MNVVTEVSVSNYKKPRDNDRMNHHNYVQFLPNEVTGKTSLVRSSFSLSIESLSCEIISRVQKNIFIDLTQPSVDKG